MDKSIRLFNRLNILFLKPSAVVIKKINSENIINHLVYFVK